MCSKIVAVLFIILFEDVWCANFLINTSRYTYYPKNCKEVLDNNNKVNGIYTIQPNLNSEPFMVLCDMEINGGGWTHIHKRFDGSLDFNRIWTDYKYGFGDLDSEFWLGLENMYQLTGYELNELLIELMDANDIKAYARYEHFSIGSEFTQYSIKVLGPYNGTAGDSLRTHKAMKFSTHDKKNDYMPLGRDSCAQFFGGGWWYKDCHTCNLNRNTYIIGPLKAENKGQGIIWGQYHGYNYGLKSARMLIRPVPK